MSRLNVLDEVTENIIESLRFTTVTNTQHVYSLANEYVVRINGYTGLLGCISNDPNFLHDAMYTLAKDPELIQCPVYD